MKQNCTKLCVCVWIYVCVWVSVHVCTCAFLMRLRLIKTNLAVCLHSSALLQTVLCWLWLVAWRRAGPTAIRLSDSSAEWIWSLRGEKKNHSHNSKNLFAKSSAGQWATMTQRRFTSWRLPIGCYNSSFTGLTNAPWQPRVITSMTAYIILIIIESHHQHINWLQRNDDGQMSAFFFLSLHLF